VFHSREQAFPIRLKLIEKVLVMFSQIHPTDEFNLLGCVSMLSSLLHQTTYISSLNANERLVQTTKNEKKETKCETELFAHTICIGEKHFAHAKII